LVIAALPDELEWARRSTRGERPRLTDDQKLALDRVIARDLSNRQTAYNLIKRRAKRPSRPHLE